ncbi:MAG: hypothetical protein H8E37_07135 [Planctomycetes bacterium]|nr:hypothetical protein [Planctomycetota bacterium]
MSSPQPSAIRAPGRLSGRSFIHPLFDYLLIGGGLSLIVMAFLYQSPRYRSLAEFEDYLPFILLLSNSAHLASSTVRLYTIPGGQTSFSFLTRGLPLFAFVCLGICIAMPEHFGVHLQSLYLTWSPYHYAAQAYGLSVMYSFRSGCQLEPGDKKLLWWASMLPFVVTFLAREGVGIRWLIPRSMFSAYVDTAIEWAATGLSVLAFAAPLLLFARIARSKSGTMPLICPLIIIANAAWFILFDIINAFVWATVFHGIQYLSIVIIFHVKDQLKQSENQHGVGYHVLAFYGKTLLLAYGLFQLVPRAFVFAGFGGVESTLLAFAAINVHHFVVDAYIWRLKKDSSNRSIVEESPVPI